jgi:hypothetical protein
VWLRATRTASTRHDAVVITGLPNTYNQPAFITALLFGFVVIKVVWIARGDIPTALGVFNSAGLAAVIAGGLLSALPVISAVVLGLAAFDLVSSQPFRRAFPFVRLCDKSVWVTGLAATVGCFFLTPWPIMAFGAVIGAVAGGAALYASKKKIRAKEPSWNSGYSCLVGSIPYSGLESSPLLGMASS